MWSVSWALLFFYLIFFLTRLERLGTAAGAAVQTAAGVPEDLPVCLAAVCMIGVNYRRVSVCLWGGGNRLETKEAILSFLFCITEPL